MAERATINEVVQIGVEADGARGTAVAASKRLGSMRLSPWVNAEVETFKPSGNKFATVQSLVREWSEADVEGVPTYDELIYPLSGVLGTPVVTTPAGGTLSRKWAWSPSSTSEDVPKSLTIEKGSATRAHRTTYCLFTEFSFSFSRTSQLEIGGTVLGKAIEDGITLTSSPTDIPLVPILPNHMDVYIDTTQVGLGTTQLLRNFSGEFSISDRWGHIWAVNSAQPSFSGHYEIDPTFELTLAVEADAQGAEILTALRTGDTRFIRLKATGAIIELAITYSMVVDLAVKVADVGDLDDEDGLQVVEYTFEPCHDATWGKALTVELVNTRTAL